MKDTIQSFYRSRVYNCTNVYQNYDKHKRVLCVCSAGLLRSPTAAFVLGQEPYNFNTRAAGVFAEYALVPVDGVLLTWADEIVCMTAEQKDLLQMFLKAEHLKKPVIYLNIPDTFGYRDPELIQLIKKNYPWGERK